MLKPFRTFGVTLIALFVFTSTFYIGCALDAPDPFVDYSVSFPNLVQHEARVTATFSGLIPGESLEVRMSRTSPGRYAMHEFVKNVYDVAFKDGTGNWIGSRRQDPHGWTVDDHDGTVTVSYTVFGDQADGTYNGFGRSFAHMNMPATFLWARGMEDAPVSVRFERPDASWDVATQLFPTEDPTRFTAPDFAYFMDSPVRIGPMQWFSHTVGDGEESQEIRIALQHDGTPEVAARWAENMWKIVDEQVDVFGEAPRYDGQTYTFLSAFLPDVHRDGMEHRNSTVVTHTVPLSADGKGNLGTMAHEFFHQWNVERIRPETLEPFNFEAANPSDMLWLAEGFTNYYEALSIRRAGIHSDKEFAEGLIRPIQTVLNSPARAHRSAVEMSEWAVFSDRGVSADRMNMGNTFLSYYTWGSVIGLSLDLTLRAHFDTNLDTFMRLMWTRFGKEEIPYTLSDARQALADVSGDSSFATTFFKRYVEGRDVPDLQALLGNAGFELRRARPGKAATGGTFLEEKEGLFLSVPGPEGSAVYEAGMDQGDALISINGGAVTTMAELDRLLEEASPGDRWEVLLESRGAQVSTLLVLQEDPTLELVLAESGESALPDSVRAFRTDWLKD